MSDIVREIVVDQIDDPQHAMRSEVRDDSLWDLADNIKRNGLINPITVRPVGNRYEVVAGHRRFSACKINGMVKIPAVVRELTEQEAFAVMAAENLERKDVDIVDEASFIAEYMERTGHGVKETAEALRRSPAYVETRLVIGQMPDYMQAYLKAGTLKIGVALALVQIENERIRELWTHDAARNGITVAMAEYQLGDYRAHQAMYDGAVEAANGGAVPEAPQEVMFTDELDGERYSIRLIKTVALSEATYPVFLAFASEWRKGEASPELEPGG